MPCSSLRALWDLKSQAWRTFLPRRESVIPVKALLHTPSGHRRDDFELPPAVAEPLGRSWTEPEAFAYCTQLTKSHYENFPVGSALIPGRLQPAIHSLYAFMRTADDFSDEDRRPQDELERLAWMKSWQTMLDDCAQGHAV